MVYILGVYVVLYRYRSNIRRWLDSQVQWVGYAVDTIIEGWEVMSKADDYIPTMFDEEHALFLVRVRVCAFCKSKVVFSPGEKHRTFPINILSDFRTQAERAGLKLASNYNTSDFDRCREFVCVDCYKAGRVHFTCALCEKSKSINKIESGFGDPPEHMCSDCFATVPAKQWYEKEVELIEEHKYDFNV